jgi:hypothetical protein
MIDNQDASSSEKYGKINYSVPSYAGNDDGQYEMGRPLAKPYEDTTGEAPLSPS